MRLRTRTLLTITATTLVLVLVMSGLVHQLVRSEFLELERREVLEHVDALEGNLKDKLNDLEMMTKSWSAWDEMYTFSAGQDPGFPQRVLTESGIAPIDVNLVIVLSPQGRAMFDLFRKSKQYTPTPKPLLDAFLRDANAFKARHPKTATHLMPWNDRVLVYSRFPILHSNDSGPAMGELIFGRFLDASIQAQMEAGLATAITLRDHDFLQQASDQAVQVKSEEQVTGLLALRDGLDRRIGWLEFQQPRTIYAQGFRVIGMLSWGAGIGLIFLMLVISFVLERGVLRRLARLTRDVSEVGLMPDAPRRVTVDTSDEIGKLAASFNATLDLVSEARQRAIQTAKAQQELLDRLTDVVIETDGDLRIASLNAAWQDLTHQAVLNSFGRHYLEFVHPEDRAGLLEGLAQYQTPGEHIVEFAHRICRPDGEVRWISGRGRVVCDQRGRVVSTSSALSDITDRKQIEDSRQEITARYEALLRHGGDTVYLLDREGRILYASPNFGQRHGFDPSMIRVGETKVRFWAHPDDQPLADQFLQDLANHPGEVRMIECRLHPNISAETYEIWGRNLEHDPNVKAILINTRDITARKASERAHLESERRLRLHLERAPLAVLEWGPDLIVKSWNAAAERTFGYSASEVVGRSTLDILETPIDNQDPANVIQELVFSPRASGSVNANRCKDGSSIMVEWTNTPITDEHGNLVSVISLARDVTQEQTAQHAVLESREQYRNLVEAINGVVWEFVEGQGVTYISPSVQEFFGYSQDEWCANAEVWQQTLHPEDHDWALEQSAGQFAAVKSGRFEQVKYEAEYRMLARDGRTVWVRDLATVTRNRDGRIRHGGVMFNITDRKRIELELSASEERYALAVRGANDGIWDWDLIHDVLYASERCHEILGYTPGELGTINNDVFYGLVHPDDEERVRDAFEIHLAGRTPALAVEFRMRHQDGAYRWVLCRGVLTTDATGEASRMAGSMTDLSERSAYYDLLTGLPGRRLLVERLEQAIAVSERDPQHVFTLLFADLDRFKVINDSLGHSIGDALLIEIARRLEGCVRPGDVVARWGGDEFVMLLDGTGRDQALLVAQRLRSVIAQPVQLGSMETFTDASIGLVSSSATERPGDRTSDDYLRAADTAMYAAKTLGSGIEEYDLAMRQDAVKRMELGGALRRALEAQEFRAYYQPIVDLTTLKVQSVEALVRWQHPKRGMVAPMEFIGVAEETGLITAIGEWMLFEACRQLREWLNAKLVPACFCVSVNIAGAQLRQPNFPQVVQAALDQHGLHPDQLHLEITESSVVAGSDRALETLEALRALGVKLHLDDFGTGYSSLSYLQRLPINTLKIDRSFLRGFERERDREIVRSVVSLAKALDLDVICEGVETLEHMAWLAELGCPNAQGYLFSKPVPAHTIPDLVAGDLLFSPSVSVAR